MLIAPLLLAAAAAFAAEPPRVTPARLPDWFPASLFKIAAPGNGFDAYDYAEGSFVTARHPKEVNRTMRGRYWKVEFESLPAERAKGGADGFAKYDAAAKVLAKAGFREIWADRGSRVFGTFERGGAEPAMASLWIPKKLQGKDGTVVIVERASDPDSVVLRSPGAVPEPPDMKAGFPYLAPLSSMRLNGVGHGDQVQAYCMTEKEPCEQRRGEWHLRYVDPDRRVSPLAFADSYADALQKAGWTVGRVDRHSGSLNAHYAKNGRDIWLNGHHNFLGFEVSDVGLELAAALRAQCKAAVYGVNFDFDKADLRPDAEPALSQVLDVLRKEPKLSVEIGGHTDNVGDKAYNLKLSGRRADAVKAWLTSRGVAASRLSARGYGDGEPVVKNDTEEHRFLNRRVELKKADCR